ncbi:MAG TPA: sigma-70 family RNA polymerase sigma factor [Kofleriaceae bacterium]
MPAALASLTAVDLAWHRAPAVTGPSALAEAVRMHESVLAGIARRLCGNAHDADDLLHDTYERALRGWDRYADRGNLRGWLISILHHLFVDRCRKAKRTPAADAIDPIEVPAPEVAPPPAWSAVTPAQLADALAELGDDFRAVYELHAAGKSYDEIARELSIAKATVGTRLLRARQKLKVALVRASGETP